MRGSGYTWADQSSRNFPDGKRLAGLFFRQRS